MSEHEDSVLLRKEACPCGTSSDGFAVYSDGHGFCFRCDKRFANAEDPDERPSASAPGKSKGLLTVEPTALGKRRLTEETCRKWRYGVGTFNGKNTQIAQYLNEDGTRVVAQKIRLPSKDFPWMGDTNAAPGLYGIWLWKGGGKKVVITEGEIDAMTVSQLQDHKWPVVSVKSGAKGAHRDIKKHLEWLNSFEQVILMFDNDDPGQEAVEQCVHLFPPGKVAVARLPLKDASDMLQAGRGREVIECIWNAKQWRPDGVVRISDIKAEALMEPEMGLPWWSETLTKLTYGRRLGESYAFGAGTGIGKTDWFTQQMVHDVQVLGEKIAVFSLEQKPAETLKRIAGKHAGRTFHIPDGTWEQQELVDVLDQMDRDDRVLFYDNFGATDWNVIANTIRFLAHNEGIRLFYLDHLTALAAAEEDEKKGLERITSEMGSLLKELDIIIHFISHLATPEGKPHEEGGRVMIRHFKGSRAIGFWAHFMFGLERDQQHDDPRWRSITTFRVLKDRFTGRATGAVIYLGYDPQTGHLFETEPPEEDQGFDDETGGGPSDY